MSDNLVGALLGGGVAGLGLVLLITAIVGVPVRDRSRPGLIRLREIDLGRTATLALVGTGVGVVVLLFTRWLVLAVALGLLAGFWTRLFGGAAEERRGIAYLDALSSWTESLRDTIAGAVGLEQAIPSTAANAAPAIRPALNQLVDRLRIREPMPTALLRFADDLDDPSADLIIAALVLNARLRGPGLREVLTALAVSAREELDMRRRVEAARRSTRRSVQIVVGVTLSVAGLLIVFNRSYVKPYNTAIGQAFLAVAILLFAAGVMWLRRLARIEVPDRFLAGAAAAAGPSGRGTRGVAETVAGGVRA